MRGAVAVFCDPVTYPSTEIVQNLRTQGITTAVGLHPLIAGEATKQILRRLGGLTWMREVVGVGEVGLYCGAPLHPQRQALAKVLELVRARHVLVLHCCADSARRRPDLFASLFFQCRGNIPATTKIHLHCFNKNVDAVKQWTSHFSNVHFGFTRMADNFNKDSQAALRKVGVSQLLLWVNFHTGF